MTAPALPRRRHKPVSDFRRMGPYEKCAECGAYRSIGKHRNGRWFRVGSWTLRMPWCPGAPEKETPHDD